MHLTLPTIEKALPLHFQRLLVDGIVDFAESSEPRTKFTEDITLAPYEARLLHNRWTLRAMVSQSRNGYLTSSTRNDADELMSGFQMALSDLTTNHLQIAKSIQAVLMDDDKRQLSKQIQLDAFFDLGMYFFSFNGYEKAYECFSRAGELADDYRDEIMLTQEEKDSLEGYLAACEAVLESRSMAEGDTLSKSPKAQIELAWESKDWDRVIELLQHDMVAYELTRLPPGYRSALEQRALRLVRVGTGGAFSRNNDQNSVSTLRLFYKRLALGNTLLQLVDADDSISLETCVCGVFRLLQEEIYQASIPQPHPGGGSRSCHFDDLAMFVLRLTTFLYNNVEQRKQARLRQMLKRLVANFYSIRSLDGAEAQLERCGLTNAALAPVNADRSDLLDVLASESHLRTSIDKQRAQLRFTSDLNGLFTFERTSDRDAFVGVIRNAFAETKSLSTLDEDDASGNWKNLIMFCMLHNCWDALAQWKVVAKEKSLLSCQLEFAIACGALMQYFSSLEGTHVENGKPEFSIATSNKLVADILLKRRQVLEMVAGNAGKEVQQDHEDIEVLQLLIDLPLWILETLVCISAGLLHRAHMRNICDYRISFELTPYGDLAFLQAFAPETVKKKAVAAADDESKESSSSLPDSSFMTAPFIKNFQADLVALHHSGLNCLTKRCSREPRWHCSRADISLNPIVKQKLSSTSGTFAWRV